MGRDQGKRLDKRTQDEKRNSRWTRKTWDESIEKEEKKAYKWERKRSIVVRTKLEKGSNMMHQNEIRQEEIQMRQKKETCQNKIRKHWVEMRPNEMRIDMIRQMYI